MFDLKTRIFREEDISGIVELYRLSNLNSPHFLRDEGYFRHLLSYPGVSPEGVFVAVEEERIEGVIVISLTYRDDESEGKIIDGRLP